MTFYMPIKKSNQKKAPVSQALRVRLRVGAAAGRAGTRPAFSGTQTAAASLSSAAPMLDLVTKGNNINLHIIKRIFKAIFEVPTIWRKINVFRPTR
jgi:hypothetical protein